MEMQDRILPLLEPLWNTNKMKSSFILVYLAKDSLFAYLFSSPKMKCFFKENTVFTPFNFHRSLNKVEVRQDIITSY
jgi:hypothetical protein